VGGLRGARDEDRSISGGAALGAWGLGAVLLLPVALAACGAPAAHTTTPATHGSGPPGADGSDEPQGSDAPPAVPACIPAGDSDLDLAFDGDDLVVCAVDRAGGKGTLGCWDVDPGSGEITARASADLPGYGRHVDGHCAGSTCWDEHDDGAAGHTGTGAWIATNGDGRLAVIAHGRLEVFDGKGTSLAKRALGDTKAPKPWLDDATVANVYFVGDTVYVLARDAGSLYELPIGKPAAKPIRNLAAGGVGVSRDKLVVHEQALSRLTTVDGRTLRVTKGRAHHDDPCHPDAGYGFHHEPAGDACADFLASHYHPYIDATIVAEGDGFYGVDPHARALFTLDDHLAETSRYPLPTCK
jgi:hypothetical protein